MLDVVSILDGDVLEMRATRSEAWKENKARMICVCLALQTHFSVVLKDSGDGGEEDKE